MDVSVGLEDGVCWGEERLDHQAFGAQPGSLEAPGGARAQTVLGEEHGGRAEATGPVRGPLGQCTWEPCH